MAHQNAGDQGKPSIHIGKKDSVLAEDLGVENESPSTVYSDSLEKWKKYRKIKKNEVKDAKSQIVKITNRIKDRYEIDREDLIEDIIDGEIVE